MNRKRIYNLRYRRKYGKRKPHQALMIRMKRYFQDGYSMQVESDGCCNCLYTARDNGYLEMDDSCNEFFPTAKGTVLYEKYINKYKY